MDVEQPEKSADQNVETPAEAGNSRLWSVIDTVRGYAGKLVSPVLQAVDRVLDRPIRNKAERDMLTVESMPLTSGQRYDIAESKKTKYIGATKDSMRRALLGAPGLLVLGSTGAFFSILNIIATVAGLSWYTITLKDVQKAHMKLGIEMTSNVLRAFLTSLFAFGVAGTIDAVGKTPHLQMAFDWMREAGYDPQSLFNSAEFQTLAIALGIRMEWEIISDLHTATVQFDSVDTLQAGAGPTALRFFENSISNLQKAVDLLRDEHGAEAANASIAVAVGSVHDFLTSVEAPIGNTMHNASEKLVENIDISVQEFDKIIYPLLSAILDAYGTLTEEEGGPIHNMHQRAMKALHSIEEKRVAEEEVSQGHSDQVIAIALDCIKDCMNAYQDRIGDLAQKLHEYDAQQSGLAKTDQ